MFDKVFEEIGRRAGSAFKKGKWFYSSLLGSEEEAIEAEFSIGLEMARAFAKEQNVIKNQTIKDIGLKIKEQIDSNHKFNFYVIRGEQINAFALPGGFIFVTEPLLELCNYNHDEIAFVLGHEMAHVIKGHAMERILAEYSISTLANLISTKGIILGAAKKLSTKYLMSTYSKENEFEADLLGAKIMIKSGFKYSGSIQLLTHLKVDQNEEYSYFGSHPLLNERIEKIEEFISSCKRK